jgi:[acyl-carrier-protein] S-malonyltransferase
VISERSNNDIHAAPTAILFPGQGSQTDAMTEDVKRWCADLIEDGRELGIDLVGGAGDGTQHLQPAIYCASIAGLRRLREEHPGVLADATCMAGHSLGEVAALVAAGSIDEAAGLRLVATRGQLMDEAAQASPGGMLALRADVAFAERLADRHELTVSNDNAPEQVVLSGEDQRLERAADEARESGRKARRLPIAGAFHSSAMQPIAAEFAEAVARCAPRTPRIPVFSSVSAAPFDDISARLVEGLTGRVRWRETLLAMHGAGIRHFVEAGPGKVLLGLARRTLDDPSTSTIDALATAAADLEPTNA